MLILWLRTAFIFVLKLLIPAPPQRTRIDPAAPCPGCGSGNGSVETVVAEKKIVVQHHCLTCQCFWYEEPIRTDVAIRAATVVNPPTQA